MNRLLLILSTLLLIACNGPAKDLGYHSSCSYAQYFDIIYGEDSTLAIVVISPDDLKCDTVWVHEPMDNIICMSSSHVAALSELGADSLISAVSGISYISNPRLRDRYADVHSELRKPAIPLLPLYDIGYEASLDYEKILSLQPDILVTYKVSSAEPPYINKLRSLGIPVLVLNDHLENHPLARAEYIRLFGALTQRSYAADSIFCSICDRYENIAESIEKGGIKVLINVPYADAWYIPGQDSYMSHLLKDAGAVILGSMPGPSSGIISMEKAYSLSQQADFWLNPGNAMSRGELLNIHQLFSKFGPIVKDLPIYNNTLRTNPEGGNDFWESGAMRPDLILEDLKNIFEVRQKDDSLHYFIRLD